ncbi:hypothetical protein GOC74_12255 [Halomicrobium mukohataei]|uniref:Uncharacterized protein n=1 Tax=Halomicrobium mukohataei TaxID=57705 RepID=A0A847UDY6_9EURY|nr:hypothetical protein [Halomicrobium mukohataei]NLV10696.1 hypothetical protein [Halomicrobium mukohataei]
MFTVRCVECGATEQNGVSLFKEDTHARETNPDATISTDIKTIFHCEHCDLTENVSTGILPEKNATHFESHRESASGDMTVRIDGSEVPFRSVDEQITENAYYNSEGVRGTSKIHHVHIHARNPPTFSKGSHTVEIGDYVCEEMILGDIRYHDSETRTLKFFRSLKDDGMEPLDKQTREARDAPAGQ